MVIASLVANSRCVHPTVMAIPVVSSRCVHPMVMAIPVVSSRCEHPIVTVILVANSRCVLLPAIASVQGIVLPEQCVVNNSPVHL